MKNMALFHSAFLLWASLVLGVPFSYAQFTPSKSSRLTDLFAPLSFGEATSVFFGADNIKLLNNGSGATISLDNSSGSGFVSKNSFHYGFFSAAIKLPPGYTSGVVVAFYLTNSGIFPHNHDEIDFEMLGHEKRRDWILQTNIYGNGSVRTGREEKFRLWFDPTAQFHEYSILWNDHHVVFLVDNIPIREVIHTTTMSSAYPLKPMSLHVTIWDASDWATAGGKYPVDYKYAPFTASLGKLEMNGACTVSNQNSTGKTCPYKGSSSTQSSIDPVGGQSFAKLSQEQVQGLQWARKKYMIYSYCKDTRRYKVLPPECNTK